MKIFFQARFAVADVWGNVSRIEVITGFNAETHFMEYVVLSSKNIRRN